MGRGTPHLVQAEPHALMPIMGRRLERAEDQVPEGEDGPEIAVGLGFPCRVEQRLDGAYGEDWLGRDHTLTIVQAQRSRRLV